MNKISIEARAKINLTLDILKKRPDGYHEVEMVMQAIELHDTVVLEEAASGIEVGTNHPLLTSGQSNIAYKAAQLLTRQYNIRKGLKIFIDKQIPVAAGLAGGSTDAAAVLKGINRLWDLGLKYEELAEIGAQIGSDVPFCISGGTALAKGRGELISFLTDMPETWMVLAKPPIEVSTAEVYRNFHLDAVGERPATQTMLKALEDRDAAAITSNLGNVLESVTLNKYPVVRELKQAMMEAGINKPLMSGSGPSVFGFAAGLSEAREVSAELQKKMPGLFVAVTRTWPRYAGI